MTWTTTPMTEETTGQFSPDETTTKKKNIGDVGVPYVLIHRIRDDCEG